MTFREFRVLLNGLPDQSRFRIALTNGLSSWTVGDHLLATLIDVAQIANWQRASTKKKPAPKPKPIQRPADIAKNREQQAERRDRWADFKRRALERRERTRG